MQYSLQEGTFLFQKLRIAAKVKLLTANQGLVLYFICTVFTERSAAPQTTLWRGPWPRFEPGTGGSSLFILVYSYLHKPYLTTRICSILKVHFLKQTYFC